jgi:hypothetical protein
MAVVLFFAGLTGCASLLRPEMLEPGRNQIGPDVLPLARDMLRQVQEKNEKAGSFKGIGRVRLWDGATVSTTRAAWAGTLAPQLRIEFLGLPGQPVARFLFNGQVSVFYSLADQQRFEKRGHDPDLSRVTGVDVTAGEVILLLSGGIPVYDHDDVSIESVDGSRRQVLILRKRFFGIVEKIYFNGPVIEKVSVFQGKTNIYQAEIRDIRPVDGHLMPFAIHINNPAGQGFSFHADRLWAGIALRPDMFEPAAD